MSRVTRTPIRSLLATLVAASTTVGLPLFSADLRPGYRPVAYAIRDATIVTAPGATIAGGTVVVRDGRIEAVGPTDKVTIPFDAETIEGKDLVVYPGFIDLYTTIAQAPGTVRSRTGAGRAVNYNDNALARTPPDNRNGLTPEFEVASALDLGESLAEERRKLGFTSLVSAPAGAIVTGQSVLASTGGLPRREAILRSPLALHINLKPPFEPAPTKGDDDHAPPRSRGRSTERYPTVLMGVVAHLRQAMLDAEYEHSLSSSAAKDSDRPTYDPSLQALYAAKTGRLPVWWEANTRDEIHRALDLAEEFGTSAVIVGGREAGKVAERLKAQDVPVVLRVDFPDEPKVPTEAEYRKREAMEQAEPLQVLVDKGARWKERLETAKALSKAGVRFAFSTDGISKVDQFPGHVRKVISAGLTREAALDALTRRAAEIAGVDRKLGTIEPGKLGHLVVLSAPFGDENAKVRYILVDGQKFEVDKPGASKKDEGESKSKKSESKKDEGEPKSKKSESKKDEGEPKSKKSESKSDTPKAKSEEPKTKELAKSEPSTAAQAKTKGDPTAPTTKSESTTASPLPPKVAEDQPSQPPFRDVSTEFDEARKPKLKTGGTVFIKDATILTVAKEGTIAKGSILIKGGKIAAIGEGLSAPKDVTVIDATGLVAMPGIIDTHSHIAIQGGVNEWSLSLVPEVRVKDVVTGDDPAIYRALAGGTTTARLLHGSADTIGGQDAVIKLRYGQAGRDLIVKDSPQGVKFALGENVTRVPGRFPNTRMGVEATIDRAFEEARAYRASWVAYEGAKGRGESPVPPRRDLRLEALAGVLDGSIKIHCHCYRSDEILMLLGVASKHGVRVQSLQHVLEGYKVAAEIAAHGATASTFSDWWAYKVEAYDAIPYNAALMSEAGVSVSIKSDSDELIRHLNLEAAKMVKYGGLTEAQALSLITINPARELGLQDRIGSLEVGKDGDLSLFNAHPFDAFARCELAVIDGEVAFQRESKDGKLTPRPGNHATMPGATAEAKEQLIEKLQNPRGDYALVGASLHPVGAPDIPDGTLVIREGKISAIGGPETPVPSTAQRIDAQGLDVWPGIIDAGTRLGLFEIGSLAETHDDADSAQFQPELRASTALHPDSEIIPVARANGILTAYVQPNGGLISGQGCAISLEGWVPREMVLADTLALHVTIPDYIPPETESSGRRGSGDAPNPRQRRKEQLESIREEFRKALAYDKVVAEARTRRATAPTPDPRLAALAPYAKGEKPVIFRVEHRNEILDALKIAEELKLQAILSGASDAWKVVDAIKAAKVPVLVGGTLQLPNESTDPYDAPYANPARLHEAGIPFAIRSNPHGPEQATASRNLPYEAATAVAFGLPEAEALKAITLAPAKILGIADQVGSLEVGKRANVVVTAGHLLQPTTQIKALFLNGKPVDASNRHTRLFEKYRRRLTEIQAGSVPLGIDPPPSSSPEPSPAPVAPASAPAADHTGRR